MADCAHVRRRAIYEGAFPAATGKPPATLATISGRTELDIMAESLRLNDIEPTDEMVTQFVRALVQGYQDARDKLRTIGRALPGVEDTARIKLEVFTWTTTSISMPGPTATTTPNDPSWSRSPAKRTGVMFGNDATVMIGDTPKDVEAGLAAAVRSIGVATGKTSTQELRDVGVQHVAANLVECQVILTG